MINGLFRTSLKFALPALLTVLLMGCGADAETKISVPLYGSGTVTLPSGETCRENCSFPVSMSASQAWANNYRVKLSAQPDPGYELLSWNQPDCDHNSLECSMRVKAGCIYVAGPILWQCLAWDVLYTSPKVVFLDKSTVATEALSPYSSCVISHGGDIQCWGFKDADQVPTLSNPSQVTSHRTFACAQDDYGIQCWGTVLPQVPEDALQQPYTLSAGNTALCALDANGVQCWRRDRSLMVPPLQSPTQLQAGVNNHCAVDATGTVCWEYNLNGDLVK